MQQQHHVLIDYKNSEKPKRRPAVKLRKLAIKYIPLVILVAMPMTLVYRATHNTPQAAVVTAPLEDVETATRPNTEIEITLPPLTAIATTTAPVTPPPLEITPEQAIPNPTPQKPQPVEFRKTIQPGDSLAQLFSEAGLSNQQLYHLIKQTEHKRELEKIFPGEELHLTISPDSELLTLSKTLSPLKTLEVARDQAGIYKSSIYEKNIERVVTLGTGVISDSFYMAAKQAQLSDKLIMQLRDIFAYDIDYTMDIYPNDRFKVLYEKIYADGEFVNTGHILRATFETKGKTLTAIRYANNGKIGYYTPKGQSLQKGFLRNPVEARVSSHFNLNRKHPILHKIRAHKGVDYAAPRGTPIRAVGQGKITFLGVKGGYGNVIELQHGPKYSTLYGHMSGFAPRLKQGQNVQQGQVIGYVGASGLATGPHLHYEFRINGVHKNPLTVTLPRGDGEVLHDAKFFQVAKETAELMYEKEKTHVAKQG